MAKLAFFAAVLVALVALSAAEWDNTQQQQCQRQLQQSSLEACRRVVDHQLAAQRPFFLSPQIGRQDVGLPLTGSWVQGQCCQQLRYISRECRAAAIRQIVRHYERQVVVPLREDPYYPGEDEEQQGGSYYPGEDEEQQGGSYYPSETYRQQGQGWEHQQGPGWSRPSQTSRPGQQHQGPYRPWWQQQQGPYRPSQTSRPCQQQQGQFYPSETFPQHQQQQTGGQVRVTIYRQPAQQGQGQSWGTQSQRPGFGGFSYPPRYGAGQQARLRALARARQVAAQLPAMCRLQVGAFPGSQK